MQAEKSHLTGIAVWGIGNHARRNVLPAVRECKSLNLIGIGSRNEGVRREQSGIYDCQAWDSLEDILTCPDVEVVYLATPIGLHHNEGLKVFSAGKHLWCEKSLTSTLEDGVDLHRKSQDKDLALCLVCSPLYHPQYAMLLELLDEDAIGTVQSISARFDFPHMQADNIRYQSELGGSALLDLGFYPIIVATGLAGVESETIFGNLVTESGYQVDTAGNASFETRSGIRVSADWGYGRAYQNEIEIQGSTGSIRVSPAFSKPAGMDISITFKSGDIEKTIDVPGANQFTAMLDAFSRTIKDRTLRSTHRDWALGTQQLLEKVRQASI